MTERTRFDPLGWFLSACLTLLFGAVALAFAVSIIQRFWPWLVGILIAIVAIMMFIRLLLGWSRKQPW